MATFVNRITTGISFEKDLLEKGKVKAIEKRQSFSAYINELIFLDTSCQQLATRGSLSKSQNEEMKEVSNG